MDRGEPSEQAVTGPGDMPREPHTFTTMHFVVPRRALEAIDVEEIAERAKAAGLPRHRFEQNTRGARPGMVRITCQRLLAPFIIEAFRDLASRAEGDLVFAAVAAAKAGLDALA